METDETSTGSVVVSRAGVSLGVGIYMSRGYLLVYFRDSSTAVKLPALNGLVSNMLHFLWAP